MANWLDDQEILRAVADDAIETLVSEAADAGARASKGMRADASPVQAAPIDEAVLNAWVDDVLEELTAEMASPAPATHVALRNHPAGLRLVFNAGASTGDTDCVALDDEIVSRFPSAPVVAS
jgi:hypothetical protein